jgi:hypothetical protein
MSTSREIGLCILALTAGVIGALLFIAILSGVCAFDFVRHIFRPNISAFL